MDTPLRLEAWVWLKDEAGIGVNTAVIKHHMMK